jgi:hypothetical protein
MAITDDHSKVHDRGPLRGLRSGAGDRLEQEN